MRKFARAVAALLPLAACGGEDESEPCDPTVVGAICTIAGDGSSGYSGDDGPAVRARMSLPQDTLRVDDELYILDWNNHRVRKLEADGTMRHVAGRGELGGTLDDPANDDLNHPTGLTLNPTGTRLVIAAWHNSKLRELDLATGEILDTCGDGRRAYFGDTGMAAVASLDLPASVAYAPNGNLVIMDQANQVIRAIDPSGTIDRVAGQCVVGACEGDAEPVACPNGSGKWTCVEGGCGMPCTPAYGGDEGPAMALRMSQPFGQSADPAGRIAFDADGNLYFADTVNAIIRMIDTDDVVHRVAGTAPVDGVAQTGHAGDGGSALEATLYNPVDLAFDSDGSLYVSDVYNHCVRRIDPDGVIHTAVGVCGTAGYDGDGGPATEATLKRPYGIEIAGDVLYVSDTGNHVIRSVQLR